MKKIRLNFNAIQQHKQYGNKYLTYWINTITRDEYFVASVCGTKETFEYSENGCLKMEKWINEKRREIGIALHLLENEDENA